MTDTTKAGRRQERGTSRPRWMAQVLDSAPEPGWAIRDQGYVAALEHELESRFALSNGRLGVRASLEIPTRASRPGTFVAGLFDASPAHQHLSALVSLPDWLRIRLRIGTDDLSIEEGETLSHSRTLDMRRGLLLSDWSQRTPGGHQVRLRSARMVSLGDRHAGLQLVRIETLGAAPVELEARLEPHGVELELMQGNDLLSIWRTTQTGELLAIARSVAVWLGHAPLTGLDAGYGRLWQWDARPGEPADLVQALAISEEGGAPDRETTASRALESVQRDGGKSLLSRHTREWSRRWVAADVTVEGDDGAQEALRFAAYHLIGAANPDCSRSSVGARGLTGDGYLGHVFWDTEIFLLPFYTLTWPAAARAMLEYRHRTLPAARAKARAFGYRGALYAWESAVTGEEVTPGHAVGPDGQIVPILSGIEEHHISADVAYAVWQYWHATRDSAFLLEAGAEIVLETARFWASRARAEGGTHHIRGVIGPDEYHETVDDNAYTNGMARWNLRRGLALARLLSGRWPARWRELEAALGLTADELLHWREVADSLFDGYDQARGLFEQFEGFFGLEQIELAHYADRTAPIDVVLGRERTQRAQVIKQADVLMLLALLGSEHAPAIRARNFDYYEPRCGHGSSLSPAIHGLEAARLGRLGLARRYFEQTAAIDLDNTMGNSAAGVHIGALGGLWQLAVFGFAGLDISGEQLAVTPRLPDGWRSLVVPVQWRGRRLRIEARAEERRVAVTLERGRPLSIRIGDTDQRLRAGEVGTAPLSVVEVGSS